MFDLLIVVLKHWRFIAGTILASVVCAVAGSFIVPSLIVSSSDRTPVMEVSKRLNFSASAGELLPQTDIEAIAKSVVSNPVILLGALEEAGIEAGEMLDLGREVDRGRIHYAIRQQMVEGKDPLDRPMNKANKPFAVDGDSSTMGITFRCTDTAKGRAFLDSLCATITTRVREYALPLATAEVQLYEKTAPGLLTAGLTMEYYPLYRRYSIAQKLIGGELEPVRIDPVDIVFDPAKSLVAAEKQYGLAALISVIVVSLLAALIAFAVEAIAKLRADPEASGRIASALGRRGAAGSAKGSGERRLSP